MNLARLRLLQFLVQMNEIRDSEHPGIAAHPGQLPALPLLPQVLCWSLTHGENHWPGAALGAACLRPGLPTPLSLLPLCTQPSPPRAAG